MNKDTPSFIEPPSDFVVGDCPPEEVELAQIVESEFSKELEMHFAQPVQTKTAKRAVPNSRGMRFQHFVIIGPTNERAAEVIADTTRYVQNIAMTNRQLRRENEAKVMEVTKKLNETRNKEREDDAEYWTEEIRSNDEDHEKKYQRLVEKRDREKQIVALLIGPRLVSLLHTEHFDEPKYFTPVIKGTQLCLTVDNIEHPEAEPVAFWASKRKLKDIISPPFRTTLYTFHPNIIFWLDRYHIYTTIKQAGEHAHQINMQTLYTIDEDLIPNG